MYNKPKRQERLKFKSDEKGQALIITAIVLLILCAFVATTIEIPRFVNKKIKLQNAADAASYSGAIWESRLLNAISLMNDGIVAGYSAISVATAAMIADPLKAPQMLKVIKRSWKSIKKLSDDQEKVLKAAPAIISAEVNRVARANGADSVLIWTDQKSPIPRLNLKRLKGKRSPLIRVGKGGSEHLLVIAVKNPQKITPLSQRLFKRDSDKKLIALSQAHVIPDPSQTLDMFKANFDAELEPVEIFPENQSP